MHFKARNLFTVFAFSIAACNHPAERGPSAPAMEIAATAITSWRQYHDECDAAIDRERPKFLELTGKQRLSTAVHALKQLPSAPSHRYAERLAQALRKYDIAVPDDQPSLSADSSISYEELATSCALTGHLLYEESATTQPASRLAGTPSRIPYALFLEILRIIATDAPGDDSALLAAFLFFNSIPSDIGPPPWNNDDGRMSDFLALFPRCMNRFTNPHHRLNLTSCRLFDECRGTVFSMTLGGYSNALKGKVDWSGPLHPRAYQLGRDLIAAANRFKSHKPSPDTVELLKSFVEDASDRMETLGKLN